MERIEHGWWIDVGKPQQSGRYILDYGNVALLQKLAESITDPAVHLELLAPRSAIEQVLLPDWTLAAPEYLMISEITPVQVPAMRADLQILLDTDGSEIRASCVDEEGHPLSRGVCIVAGTDAIFDQIATEQSAQRQGLGSAIMGVLSQMAANYGARRGILVATADGQPFYEALGWSVLSEVSKAISPAESRSVRHLRLVSRH